MPKLTQEQHEEIYDQKGKVPGYKLAEKYKVSPTTIYNILKGMPPKAHREALYRIRLQLEKGRGLEMSLPVFEMWTNIYNIVNDALGDMP